MSFAVRKLSMLKNSIEKEKLNVFDSICYVSSYDIQMKKNIDDLLKKLENIKI